MSLSCQPGQWVSVVGPNGVGKSTALRALALQPDGPLRAWLPQQPEADPRMTVAELVALGRLPHQRWWQLLPQPAADQQVVHAMLDAWDLQWASQRPVGQLSGGERQRAHLARVMATQAPVLLLDEPTAHLDAPHHRHLVRLLRQHTARGGAVITVLHELSMALMADHVLVMNDGQVVLQGSASSPDVHRGIEQVFDHTLRIVLSHGFFIPVPCL